MQRSKEYQFVTSTASGLPYMLIFGGTDIHVFCDDPDKMAAMTLAVHKARFVRFTMYLEKCQIRENYSAFMNSNSKQLEMLVN